MDGRKKMRNVKEKKKEGGKIVREGKTGGRTVKEGNMERGER